MNTPLKIVNKDKIKVEAEIGSLLKDCLEACLAISIDLECEVELSFSGTTRTINQFTDIEKAKNNWF